MTRLWLVAMMVMAVGCSDEESSRCEPVADAGAPSADLAIGDSSGAVFAPWANGDTAELINGLQGGWMLVLGLRAPTLSAADSACTTYNIAVPEGLDIPPPPVVRTERAPIFRDQVQVSGYQLFLGFNRSALAGSTIRVDASLATADGAAASSVWLELF